VAIYNELNVLRVVIGSLSINRLLTALRFVLKKHAILRTALIFNHDDGSLKQCITDSSSTFVLANELAFENENELEDIIYQITIDPDVFDLSNGRVLHCQILRQQTVLNRNNDKDLITDSDILIIAFHHAAFDRSSREIFFNDLSVAYNNETTMIVGEEFLQYIDYTVYERLIDVTSSREFWQSELKGYNLERLLLLPLDGYRSCANQRSGLACIADISFDDEISTSFLNYASSHQVTPFQLGMATFYAFLFKLTHGENDLCISCLHANRYRTELQNMIGMFVSTLPYCIRLDPQWSFDELVKRVREKCLSILEHSHYPLQHILADSHVNQSNIPFLEIVFDFIILSPNSNGLCFDGASLEHVSPQKLSQVAKFDLMVLFLYNPTLDNGKLSCQFVCSHEVFEHSTVAKIARRFQYLFEQLFFTNIAVGEINTWHTPISKLNLILLEEIKEMKDIVFCRQSNMPNEGMSIYLYIFDV